jgi:TRAP-type C4-dicarboxylate transport system substrate-binding protein
MPTKRAILRCMAVIALAALPLTAKADPVKLKLAMFSSDTEMTWVTTIKPWMDAVNAAGKGVIEIDGYPNGALGRSLPQQSQIVLNGVADAAFVVPGVTPGRFPDNEVMDLPGLFRTLPEATRVYTRLMAKHVFKGFDKYVVIGAMGTAPFVIHSRTKITSLAELNGKKIRTTNASQAATIKALGAVPILLPAPEIAEAIGRGTIDGATEFPGPLYDFGVDRVTKYDYQLPVGISTLTLLMNKAKYDSLPDNAKKILNEYSGKWFGEKFINGYGHYIDGLVAKMKADKSRVRVEATAADLATADKAFKKVVADWAKKSPRNPALLKAVRETISQVRSGG